jgi:glucokinase
MAMPNQKATSSISPSLVADIGATNIRFARLSSPGTIGPVAKFPLTEFEDFAAALEHFLSLEGGPRPSQLAIAVAGPVLDDEVKLTNSPWQFSIRDLKKSMNLAQLEVVNDLEALAHVLPHLDTEDVLRIDTDDSHRSTKAPMAVLCPGTGMGIAGLQPASHGWQPIAGEGGHTGLSPLTDRELDVWQVLRKRHGRVSVERVLSGPGIVELYSALASLEGQEPATLKPEAVVELALKGENPLAVETIEMFCGWLGDVAGDVALNYLAIGGVYLAGDILLSVLEILKRSRFRERFEHKGRVTGLVAQIPTFLITNKSPILLGCARLLDLPCY